MATLRVVAISEHVEPIGGGSYDLHLEATLTYSYTDYPTHRRYEFTKIEVNRYDWGAKNVSYSIRFAGNDVDSYSGISFSDAGTSTFGVYETVNIDKTHQSQSKTLELSLGGQVYIRPDSMWSSTYSNKATASLTIPQKDSYTVTYNANGGSGGPSSQTKWHNETLTLTSSKPYYSGYSFWHWNTSSSNGGTTYASGGTYTGNGNMTLYAIWNPIISYNANGGTGAPPSQTKTYGQTLTLSSTKPQRVGYTFLGWSTNQSATSATYSAGSSYTSNATAKLYAVWRKDAVAPRITSMSVVRCTSSGTSSDTGAYCKVTAYWSVDTTGAGMSSNQGTVTGTIRQDGTSTQTPITFSSGTSGTSGTAVAIVSGCSTDYQYYVTVTVTNTQTGTGQSSYLSTSRTDILTRAFFTMDFAVGGRGVGVGTAAPQSGFECGFDAQFDGDVTVLGNLVAPNLTTTTVTSGVATATGTFTIVSQKARTYGPFVDLHIEISSSTSLTEGTIYTLGTIQSSYRPSHYTSWCDDTGVGGINSSGSIKYRPSKATTLVYLGVTYMK